ncbi:B12-binding domain-containing radical SAM protein [Sulfolobus acidocaldarius]|uniref:Conserved Prokaryal protein n=4 Tax=Sulfolobus acidocaldarius TaxID=2285 RepID=Q4J7Z0_SULAC|nr:radical SAM protein [Sulfolobus acidocaldarius]AAY81091.1 conserved Prokaryal protein [Sulfolobus acidocaldarius DSM 639]AGE71697.1 hypothetical protein SacN8_08685 [Sulfolobus acidocaldarius N8]AGE73970.1 hypothetical protein SacRon12I_08695 [Sulfolobus acidocaldarius Ron12/I]ALU30096.1 radical SAM protein [Sulfolobus acidocaldarius]ALU30786.1 radical SAM protein [Sulfolobus acidocaldarius]
MKALLVRPTNPTGSGYNKSFGFMPTPLGLLQLAGDLRAVGNWDIKVVDMEADSLSVSDVISLAKSYDPEIVGITLHATASHNISTQLAKGIKQELNDSLIIAGGHHATFVPSQMLAEGFDIVVLGEGDLTMMEIGKNIQEGYRDLSKVNGIMHKKDGKTVRNPPAPLIDDLDKLPLPAFDLVRKELYRIDIFNEDQYVACMETARGCPYACDFCSVTPTWGNKWRNKSNSRILKEIEEIKKLGYNWIFFVDDIFIVWPNRSQREKLFREMIDRKLTINFITQIRADVTARNPQLIKLASDAGLRVAFLGIESGSQETLKKMHKGLAIPDSVKAVKVLHENGVIVFLGMMLGAPYESLKDMIATIKFSRKLADVGADGVQFSIYTPLPGTRIFVNSLEHNSIFTLNWDFYDLLTPVARTKVNPAIIKLLSVYANHTFYLYKYFKSKLRISKLKIPDRKLELLRRAEKYIWRKLPFYLRGTFIDLPKSMIGVLRLSMRKTNQVSKDILDLMISESSKIIYLEQGDKNRYFKIKTE